MAIRYAAYSATRCARRTFVILSLALAGCRGAVAPNNPTPETATLHLFAESSAAPLLRNLANNYHPPNTLISWNIQVTEGSNIMEMLKKSSDAYALVDYIPSIAKSELWVTPVGQNAIAIVVNPSNNVKTLSAAQLRSIFQGRISNWTSLGGPDLPLIVVAQTPTSSATAIMQSIVLGDRHISLASRLAPTSESVIDIVSTTPGTIGYVSMSYLNNTVRTVPLDGALPTPETVTLGHYPLRSPLVFVSAHEPGSNDAYRTFFAWVQSPAGQIVVKQHYGGIDLN